MTTTKAIIEMYAARAQQLAEQTAPQLVKQDEWNVFFPDWQDAAYKHAKQLDKQYRRALLDLNAIRARTAVELGWHFERTLRREVYKVLSERRREMLKRIDELFVRIGAKILNA